MMLTGNYVFVELPRYGRSKQHSASCATFPDHLWFSMPSSNRHTHYQFQSLDVRHLDVRNKHSAGIDSNNCNRLVFLVLTIYGWNKSYPCSLRTTNNVRMEVCRIRDSFFSICYVFFGINITAIGYYIASIEKSRLATDILLC